MMESEGETWDEISEEGDPAGGVVDNPIRVCGGWERNWIIGGLEVGDGSWKVRYE